MPNCDTYVHFTILGNCSLKVKADNSPNLASTTSVMKNSSSLGECKKLCLEHVRGTDECWGFTFNYDDNTCNIHERLALEPYSYGVNLVYFAKICYQGKF